MTPSLWKSGCPRSWSCYASFLCKDSKHLSSAASTLTSDLSLALECNTYRNWSCGSLKTLDGSTANLFLLSFSTSRELEMFSKQPGSRTLILLLLKFLWHKNKEKSRSTQERSHLLCVCVNNHKRSSAKPDIYTHVFWDLFYVMNASETGLVKHNWDKVIIKQQHAGQWRRYSSVLYFFSANSTLSVKRNHHVHTAQKPDAVGSGGRGIFILF